MERYLGRYSEVIYCLMRLMVGLAFAQHGAQKVLGLLGGQKVPLGSLPGVAGIIELVGGLLIAIGLAAGGGRTGWGAAPPAPPTSLSREAVMFSAQATIPTSPKTWMLHSVGVTRIQPVLVKICSSDSRTCSQPTSTSQPGWMQRTQGSWSHSRCICSRSSSSSAL